MRTPVFFKIRHLIPFSIFVHSFLYEGIKFLNTVEAI